MYDFRRSEGEPRNLGAGMAILSNDTPVLGDGCDGLSVDGSRLEFARPDIPVRFHKTLVNGRNNGVFDCFRFAAGMRGLPMDDRYPFFWTS